MYFILTTVLLAALLFIPASRLVFVLSVRRVERRTKTKLGPEEIAGQRRRARFVALLLVIPFALLFNYNLMFAIMKTLTGGPG